MPVPVMRYAAALSIVSLATGCARDVVLKPAVIAFDSDARASVDAARHQYDDTIVRLNRQVADFIARNPECGLARQITPRDGKGPYCLSEAEKNALPGNVRIRTEDLPIVSRATFDAQFRALNLLLDYVSFLAAHADDPKLTAKGDIKATADAVQDLGKGVSDLSVAFGGRGFKEFAPGGAVEKFGSALGDLAGQLELIAKQADDVAALEGAIKSSKEPVNGAIDLLAANADDWTCAAFERSQIEANDFALKMTPKLPGIDEAARADIASKWIARVMLDFPAYCPGGGGRGPATSHSQVAEMLLAVKSANAELVDLANHKYTPAQRKAIADATLSRLGRALSRIASLASLVL